MGSKYRGINQQASTHIPQSSNYSYFTDQARGGYMGPELGGTKREFFRDQHHPQHLHPHPRLFPHPHPHFPLHPHPHPHFPPHPHDMHEAIHREIEKERIREEIIMSEITTRCVLEAEVRRELMIERELALRRGSDGFPFGSSPRMEFDSPMRLSLSGMRAEERIAMSLEETKRLNGRRESGGFDTLPFQRATADLRISEVKPVSDGGKEKQKVIFLAKPDVNISGSKRNAVTPPGVDASEAPSDGILKKKAKEEWSCALCQVSATNERGLNEHLQGKKHKSKEAALRAERAGKNYSIGLFSKKATNSIETAGTGVKSTAESLLFKKTEEAPLQENPNSENLKKNQSELVQKAPKNDDPKNKKYRFWCEMCKVGAFSQKVMNAHKKGKKHVGRLQGSDRNGGAGPSHPEKIAVVVNNAELVAEDGKNINSENVDETLDEARLQDDDLVDAVELESDKLVDETKEEDSGACGYREARG